MNFSHRNMISLAISAAAIVAVGLNPFYAKGDAAEKEIPVGLQLYSVRKACKKDLPGVIQKVAAMGYDGVEFAGYFDFSAEELKQMLDENGLQCCGTHLHLDALQGDELQKTIDFNKKLGNRYLIVSLMPHGYMRSPETVRQTAELYNQVAKKLKPHGMLVGYHAHAQDFEKVPGADKTGWDMLFEQLDPAVVMQLDVGNCRTAGGDPVATLKKFPGRAVTVHLKEDGGKPQSVIGEGEVDWQSIFDICKTSGGTQWMIVEYEHTPNNLDNVEKCLTNIRKMTKP